MRLIAPSTPQLLTQSITLPVLITETTHVGAIKFDLSYDQSLLTLTSLSLDTLWDANASWDPNTTRCAIPLRPRHRPSPSDSTTATATVGIITYGTGVGPAEGRVLALLYFQPTGQAGTSRLLLQEAPDVTVPSVPTPTSPSVPQTVSQVEPRNMPIPPEAPTAKDIAPTQKPTSTPTQTCIVSTSQSQCRDKWATDGIIFSPFNGQTVQGTVMPRRSTEMLQI